MQNRFLVPQFIDVEAKIFGPITVRQFVLVLIAMLIDFIIYKLFLFNTFLMIAIPITLILLIFAFAKINGMPFHYFVLNVAQTIIRPSLRVWQRAEIKALPKVEKVKDDKEIIPTKGPLESSKLSNLSLMVDTGGAYSKDVDQPTQQQKPQ